MFTLKACLKCTFLKSLDTKGKLVLPNLSRSSRCFFHREKPQIQDGIFKVAITTDGVLLPSMSFLSSRSFLVFHLNANSLLYSLR